MLVRTDILKKSKKKNKRTFADGATNGCGVGRVLEWKGWKGLGTSILLEVVRKVGRWDDEREGERSLGRRCGRCFC